MKTLIIEDELVAAKRLKALIRDIDAEIEIVDVLDSVLDAVNFLSKHTPDLIFMDIHLADGICFEIFEKLEIDTPIIFTTAYDEYMFNAFKVNSVDYLLKPIHPEDLSRSIAKFNKYKFDNGNSFSNSLKELVQLHNSEKRQFKCRFLVKSGRCYVSVNTKDAAYFMSENKLNYLVDFTGKRYVMDYTLDELVNMLDPTDFCKINRNYIVSNRAIVKIEPYFNNRMLLYLDPTPDNDVLVSRTHLVDFREWMDM